VSGAVPDALDWRVAPTRHAIDRIVLAVNIDDNGTSAFAAQLALRFAGRCWTQVGVVVWGCYFSISCVRRDTLSDP
jgi:hypothetical protein